VFAPHTAERFQLETRVGAGAMGEVYRARDHQTGEQVAVKLLHRKASREEGARFHREVAMLADLRHPGIVAYVDHGTWTDGRPYFAMEWLEGEDLGQLARRQPLGMTDAVEVVRRVAQAMAAVHARGVVHRDLKLTNIFVPGGNLKKGVKLIDFGVVKPAEPDDFQTQPGSIIGTPHFMAPEQARGEPVDARSDVYSLGAVLFRLVTGRHVFETDHIIAFLGRLVLEDAPLASSVRFDVPELLDKAISRTLARNPDHRPEDAGVLARWLARLPAMNNEPPNSDQSASAIRRVPTHTVPSLGPSLPELPPGALERRVVGVVLAALPSETFPEELAEKTRAILGPDARLEVLQGGRLVAGLGLETTRGDEAVRAARAALMIATTIPDARIAVATGHAVAGRRGLAGEALDQAAIQLDRAPSGGIRIGKATRPLLQGRFVVRIDDIGGVLLHEDIAASDRMRLLGVQTPTLGRDSEIELLLSTFRQVMEDASPRAVVVTGPTGVGKSRLRFETIRRLGKMYDALDVLMARGDPMQTRMGLSALGRALRARMGIRDGEPAGLQAERVTRYVRQRSSSPQGAAAFLGEFAGVPFSDTSSEPLRAARDAPQLMTARILQVLESIIRHDAQLVPQVIVLEDLHLIDDTTREMVDWLLGCRDLRLVVFGFGRERSEEGVRDLWAKRSVTRIGLAPLPYTACERIAAMVLPDLDDRRRESILERAEGNILFLEELLRNAADGHDDLPVSVQALIQARLDQLAPELRHVVRAASIFGRQFWTDGVSNLIGRHAEKDLQALAEAELVTLQETSRIDGQTEWVFPQNAVFETAYSSLLDRDRVALHRTASEWLLIVGEEDIGTIARHAEAGEDLARAAVLYNRASGQAYGNGQLEAALDFADAAIRCGTDATTRAQALFQRAQILSWLGRYEDQLEAAETAVSCADQGTDTWGEAHRLAASAMRELGRPSDAEARFAWTLDNPYLEKLSLAAQSKLHAERTRALADIGRAGEGARSAERAIRLAHAAGENGTHAMLRALDARFMATAFLGDFSASIASAEAVVENADRVGDAVLATRARINLGFVLTRVGRFEQARDQLEKALADSRMLRMRAGEGFALHNLGMCYARLDKLDRGIQFEQEAREIGEETHHFRLKLNSRIYEAVILTWRGEPGDLREALGLIDACQQDAGDHPVSYVEATAVLAQVHRARRDLSGCLAACEDALQRLASIGSIEEGEEMLRLTYAETLFDLGRSQEAAEALREAYRCVMDRCEQMSGKEHREAFLSRLYECRRVMDLAELHLGHPRPTLDSEPPPPAVPRHSARPNPLGRKSDPPR
jgi:serine/threonine protein kinase/tetratricopeptide (TPR) repeat protein